jgi:hypothetical protein
MQVAAKMNKYALDLLGKECTPHRVGIVPMDFPGYGIIDRIIDANFCSLKSRLGPKDYGRCRYSYETHFQRTRGF